MKSFNSLLIIALPWHRTPSAKTGWPCVALDQAFSMVENVYISRLGCLLGSQLEHVVAALIGLEVLHPLLPAP